MEMLIAMMFVMPLLMISLPMMRLFVMPVSLVIRENANADCGSDKPTSIEYHYTAQGGVAKKEKEEDKRKQKGRKCKSHYSTQHFMKHTRN